MLIISVRQGNQGKNGEDRTEFGDESRSNFEIETLISYLQVSCLNFKVYSKTVNNRTRGANNEYRGGFCGPGTGFCGPGGGFLFLVDVVACHYIHYPVSYTHLTLPTILLV